MAEANLDTVIERLDRLEAALLRLVELIESRGSAALAPVVMAPVAVAQPAPVAAPHEPPRIHVAPPPMAAARPIIAPTTPAPVVSPTAEIPVYHNPWIDLDIRVPGPSASIEDVLARVFEAAMEPDPEMTWATLTRLFHSSQLVGPRAIDHFKGFAWQRLRRNARSYLVDANPRSFQIAYTDPREPTGHEKEIRVFVKTGDNRMPVPVGFQRDLAHENAWRVTMMSL